MSHMKLIFLDKQFIWAEKIMCSKWSNSSRKVIKKSHTKGRFQKKEKKKGMDLSIAHLTPASQAERWIKKFKNSTIFVMSLLSL